MGCREGLEAAAPSNTNESPLRPCSGWRRVKCWPDGRPTRGPNAAGENRLCPLTRGPLAAKGRDVAGETRTRPPTARPRKNEGKLVLHTKPRGVAVTDLSEESAFEAGRNAFAVWPRLVTVKRLSSFRPEGQERPGLAEAASLLGRFRSPRLRGRWRGKDRPRASQTSVGGGCVAWALLPPKCSFLGSECSLDIEEEGVEWSLVLLGINCLKEADCVLAEQNFSTTELTASPNSPDFEIGASSKKTFSFSRISVRFSHKWRSAATEPAIEHPTARAVCLVALRAKSVALRSSLTASGVMPVPSSISLRMSAW